MSISDQLGIYAAFIAVTLTLLRLISGITGSQSVRKSLLRSTTFTAFWLAFATFAEIQKHLPWPNVPVSDLAANNFFVAWFFFVALQFGLGVLLRLYVRSLRFKDWGTFKNLRAIPPATWARSVYRYIKDDKKNYEFDSPTTEEAEAITRSILSESTGHEIDERRPILIDAKNPWETRKNIAAMIKELVVRSNEEINYVCCTISPWQIWRLIENECNEEQIQALKQRIVFIDAYKDTYGFGDEILTERIRKMKVDEGIEVVTCDSAAGVHTATAKAFKILKAAAKKNKKKRGPCMMIYDSLSSMAISETETEVAEFVVHLSAAEMTYEMQTIFLEAGCSHRKSESINAMISCCGDPIVMVG